MSVEEMLENSAELSWFKLGKLTLSMFGLQSNEPLAKFVKETYPIEKIEDLQIPFSAVATDLDTGEAVVFNQEIYRLPFVQAVVFQ